MKKIAIIRRSLFIIAILLAAWSCQETTHFPGEKWESAQSPEKEGFNSEKLITAEKYSGTINTSAVVIVHNGVIVDEWGQVDRKFKTHSMRKSFLSELYGIYVKEGVIDLDKTLEELGIDDVPPLDSIQRTVTIRDCLKARSGIYHDALYESAGMKALKPRGLVVKPGTFWYYNNWDFNAAGTIFETLTGKKIFEEIKEKIADPIGMESYEVEDGTYITGEESIHPAYPFIITAHDCARFGLLMLNRGNWNGKQVIPADWVDESTRYHSDATLYSSDGYGYMWWVSRNYNKFPHLPGVELPEGTYSARGSGGHYILIIPDYDLVIVHRVDTFKSNNRVSKEEFGHLVKLILDARI